MPSILNADRYFTRTMVSEEPQDCHRCQTVQSRVLRSAFLGCEHYFCCDCVSLGFGLNFDSVVKGKTNWVCPVCSDTCTCSTCVQIRSRGRYGRRLRTPSSSSLRSSSSERDQPHSVTPKPGEKSPASPGPAAAKSQRKPHTPSKTPAASNLKLEPTAAQAGSPSSVPATTASPLPSTSTAAVATAQPPRDPEATVDRIRITISKSRAKRRKKRQPSAEWIYNVRSLEIAWDLPRTEPISEDCLPAELFDPPHRKSNDPVSALPKIEPTASATAPRVIPALSSKDVQPLLKALIDPPTSPLKKEALPPASPGPPTKPPPKPGSLRKDLYRSLLDLSLPSTVSSNFLSSTSSSAVSGARRSPVSSSLPPGVGSLSHRRWKRHRRQYPTRSLRPPPFLAPLETLYVPRPPENSARTPQGSTRSGQEPPEPLPPPPGSLFEHLKQRRRFASGRPPASSSPSRPVQEILTPDPADLSVSLLAAPPECVNVNRIAELPLNLDAAQSSEHLDRLYAVWSAELALLGLQTKLPPHSFGLRTAVVYRAPKKRGRPRTRSPGIPAHMTSLLALGVQDVNLLSPFFHPTAPVEGLPSSPVAGAPATPPGPRRPPPPSAGRGSQEIPPSLPGLPALGPLLVVNPSEAVKFSGLCFYLAPLTPGLLQNQHPPSAHDNKSASKTGLPFATPGGHPPPRPRPRPSSTTSSSSSSSSGGGGPQEQPKGIPPSAPGRSAPPAAASAPPGSGSAGPRDHIGSSSASSSSTSYQQPDACLVVLTWELRLIALRISQRVLRAIRPRLDHGSVLWVCGRVRHVEDLTPGLRDHAAWSPVLDTLATGPAASARTTPPKPSPPPRGSSAAAAGITGPGPGVGVGPGHSETVPPDHPLLAHRPARCYSWTCPSLKLQTLASETAYIPTLKAVHDSSVCLLPPSSLLARNFRRFIDAEITRISSGKPAPTPKPPPLYRSAASHARAPSGQQQHQQQHRYRFSPPAPRSQPTHLPLYYRLTYADPEEDGQKPPSQPSSPSSRPPGAPTRNIAKSPSGPVGKAARLNLKRPSPVTLEVPTLVKSNGGVFAETPKHLLMSPSFRKRSEDHVLLRSAKPKGSSKTPRRSRREKEGPTQRRSLRRRTSAPDMDRKKQKLRTTPRTPVPRNGSTSISSRLRSRRSSEVSSSSSSSVSSSSSPPSSSEEEEEVSGAMQDDSSEESSSSSSSSEDESSGEDLTDKAFEKRHRLLVEHERQQRQELAQKHTVLWAICEAPDCHKWRVMGHEPIPDSEMYFCGRLPSPDAAVCARVDDWIVGCVGTELALQLAERGIRTVDGLAESPERAEVLHEYGLYYDAADQSIKRYD